MFACILCSFEAYQELPNLGKYPLNDFFINFIPPVNPKMGGELGMGMSETMKKSDYNYDADEGSEFWPELLYDDGDYFDFF